MAQTAENVSITPVFYTEVVEDVKATREAGRPIMVEEERVEYRIAGNRNFVPHFQAHEFHEWVDGEEVTHAMRWPKEYKHFKETGGNSAQGTPLQNLPGLTKVQLSTLKTLSVFSIESLANIEGRELKNLGPGGHEMKRSAQQYLAAAAGRLDLNGVLQQMAELKAQNEQLSRIVSDAQHQAPAPQVDNWEQAAAAFDEPETAQPEPYTHLSDDEIKAKIKEATGSGVRGQPSRATLVGMLKDLETE